MSKSYYRYMQESRKKHDERISDLDRQRLILWRKQETVVRVDKPTKIDRARSLGYRAKQGFVVARVKVRKGGRRRQLYGRRGRKPSKSGLVHFTPGRGLQWIAEGRAAKRFPNLEVLNSYYVGEDGQLKWFEVILVDPANPHIKSDPHLKWVTYPANRRRVLRGLTSAGKKARGI